MAYSGTRIVIGVLDHVPVLIFIANLIKGEFGIKTLQTKDTAVKEGKIEAIKEISNKLDIIEQQVDEIYEKLKKKKRIRIIKKNN